MATAHSFDDLKQFIQTQGWRWQPGKPVQHGEQIVVSDGLHQATINFYPKRNNFVSGGPNSPLKAQLDAWIKGELSSTLPEASAEVATPAGTRLDALKAYLKEQGWNWGPGTDIPYGEQIVVSDAGVTALVNFWPTHGKLQVQGGDSALKAALQAWVIGENPAAPNDPNIITGAHIGLDESGKGDWFGGPVVAAVYVDDQTAVVLRRIGVRDSKALDSAAIQRMAAQIASVVPEEQRHVWAIEPETYNELYAKYNNTDLLLADIYAQVAEKVGQTTRLQVIICDQFAQRADPLEQAFATRGLPQPHQQHHAESASIAVAAASILASAAFSNMLSRLGQSAGLAEPLPKGSSDINKLIAATQHIIQQQGPEALGRYAKLNFKPVRQLLGENVTKPVANPQAEPSRPGPVATIEQPAWQMQYHPNGFWRYSFVDGGYLDWYEGSAKGTIYVHGKQDSESVRILKPKTEGKGWHGKHEALDKAIEKYIPRLHQQQIPSVLGVGWQRRDTVLGLRFDFTDGGVLQYYSSTDKLLIQGKPSTPTHSILTALASTFWLGGDILTDNLKALFPDWRLGQATASETTSSEETAAEWQSAEDGLNWREFWPTSREMRQAANKKAPCQRALVDDWASMLVHHQGKYHLLAHAPTGLGKTLAALVPALAWVAQAPDRRRVYYLVNRVTQHDNPVRELRSGLADAFADQAGQPLRVVDIVGKHLLCHHPEARSLSDHCKQSRDEAGFDQLPSHVASWQEIKTYLVHRCPYHTLQGLMTQAHIVICDYWWLFSQTVQDSNLLEKAGFSPVDTILIVDEAHNLPLRVRAELDVDEPPERIVEAIDQAPDEARSCLEQVITAVQQADPEVGISPSTLHPLVGGIEVIQSALETLTDDKVADTQASLSERILRLLLQPDDTIVIYPTADTEGKQRLVFRLVDPTPVLQFGYSQVYASLSMSGTLAAPSDNSDELRYQIPLFGLPLRQTLTRKYASPFPATNQRWIYSTDTHGIYKERQNYLSRYAEHITSIGQVTPGVTTVFFSSYAFLEQVRSAIIDSTEQALIVAETRADAESRTDSASGLGDYEQQLRELVQKYRRAYLFAVYKGKLSEGADLAGNLIKSVICISIPLEYPGLYHERLRHLYQQAFAPIAEERGDKLDEKAHEYALDRLSLSLVLQACGRGIRNETDQCAFTLLDKRYDEYDWRRFLEPRPFRLLQPANTVASFHQEPQMRTGKGWDKTLLSTCKKNLATPDQGN